jgi:thymidylate kinase
MLLVRYQSTATTRPHPPTPLLSPEERMRRNRENRSLHFVFIEGEAATGKSTICELLKQRGYTVQFEGFVELCKENSRYSPQGSVVSIKWVSSMFTAMERLLHQFDEKQADIKDRVVFFDRSFLTPYVYTRGSLNNLYVCDAMKEIKEVFPCTTVLCKTDLDTIENRLLQRYNQGDAQAKDIRKNLGELDHAYIEKVHNKYSELEADGWFDYLLDTSAPGPLVVDNLLATLRQAAIINGHPSSSSSPSSSSVATH